MKPQYLDWLVQEATINTDEGKEVEIFELIIKDEDSVLDLWAKHLREHYCADSEIDQLQAGPGLGRKEYLETIKFPDKSNPPGPSIRSGDFTEILVADYVQYVLSYIVPRVRYDRKVNRNSSTMGSDLIGYKCGEIMSTDDELIVFEIKATATETRPNSKVRLQDAVNDSCKDNLRLGESLNAVYQRLHDRGDENSKRQVQRFQNSVDNPYKKIYAAAAIHSKMSLSKELIKTVSTLNHVDPDLKLMVIHCDKLMEFIHCMYGRASEC